MKARRRGEDRRAGRVVKGARDDDRLRLDIGHPRDKATQRRATHEEQHRVAACRGLAHVVRGRGQRRDGPPGDDEHMRPGQRRIDGVEIAPEGDAMDN